MNILSSLWDTALYQPIHNLLTYLYVVSGSIGLSTFGLILFIRGFLLSPLAAKQQKDTKKVKAVQPRIEELKKKYKDDPKGLSEAQQKLYKEINYNPLGCAGNFLVQIPIYIAVYQAVRSFTEAGVTPQNMPGLYPAIATLLKATGETVFATDLFGIELFTSPWSVFKTNFFSVEAIPYIILVILLALANLLPTMVSKKLMGDQIPQASKKDSKNKDEEMQAMLTKSINQSTTYMMPIMLTAMMMGVQSVIHVYMIINGFVSMTQQLVIRNIHTRKLMKDLKKVLIEKYEIEEARIDNNLKALSSLPSSMSFLMDEIAEHGEFKSTSVKIEDISFTKVYRKTHRDPINALITFGRMAKKPEKAKDIFSNIQ